MEVSYLGLAVCVTLLGTVLLILLHIFWWKPRHVRKCLEKQGIKVLPMALVLGSGRDMSRMLKQSQSTPMHSFSNDIIPRVLPYYHFWTQKYGKDFVFWFGNKARLNVPFPELIKEILAKRNGNFVIQHGMRNPLTDMLLGRGLVYLSGDKWAKHRKIINPAFLFDRLKAMIPTMVESCDLMLDTWNLSLNSGTKEFDVLKEFRRLTADVISRTAFGSNYEQGKHIFGLQAQQMKLIISMFRSGYAPIYRLFPNKKKSECWRLEKQIREHIMDVILANEKMSSSTDLLGLMLAANKEANNYIHTKLSLEEIIDECKTFYLAGHETTSVLLTWAVILLGMYPDWQEKARNEVLQVLGKEGKPNAESISHLHTIGMILNEALRLYPPVVFLVRETNKATKLGEFSLPAGTQFLLPILPVHRDPGLWGEDVNEFNPERFREGIAKAVKHPWAFMPFGYGPQMCIGQNFALMEAKLVLAMILQSFSFAISPSYCHAPAALFILQPQYGAPVIFNRI
eukprot:TRINITY_DN8905_c0_g1_i5.p1 TRINITY_DN8905_c0_g1~~TRINITY_DN8905_c0_g1_i5.p1  ORF type:complete len:594 (+),score=83.28 TRINITY_DN8905_c0_g1_i5:248-1783(+)